MTNKIQIQERRDYFMELLEGKEHLGPTEERTREEGTEINEQWEEGVITEEEVEKQIKKLKKGKAAGEDKLENKVWIYGGKKITERITILINKVWKGEGLPDGWKERIISPIFKKGNRDNIRNYRGITLLNTAYKIYAMILEEKLKAELEQKKVLEETQASEVVETQ